jgi:hypothetical protein
MLEETNVVVITVNVDCYEHLLGYSTARDLVCLCRDENNKTAENITVLFLD